MKRPNAAAIEAIAREIFVARLADDDQDVDARDSSSCLAFESVAWARTVMRQISDDERFEQPDGPHSRDRNTNMTNEQNRYGETRAFEIGFDLGLQVGARIASSPLAEHDVTDLVAAAQEEVVDAIMRHRELLHAERARKASAA